MTLPKGYKKNTEKVPKQRRGKSSAKSKAAAIFLVVFIVIISIVIYLNVVIHNDTQQKLKEGCHPSAWNQYGQPSIWSCPSYSHYSGTLPSFSDSYPQSSSRGYRVSS